MINHKYLKEFKLDAVSIIYEQSYTQADVAQSLEISPKLTDVTQSPLPSRACPQFKAIN